MNTLSRSVFALLAFIVLSTSAFAADKDTFGYQPGTVLGFIGLGGGGGASGIHPASMLGIEVGLTRYVGIFGEGGYTCAYNCSFSTSTGGALQFEAGVKMVATNNSRFVPFAKLGFGAVRGFGRSGGYYAFSNSVPAAVLGAGLRIYVNPHFGFETQITGLRTVGNYGGSTSGVGTFGIFLQSTPKGTEHSAHSNGEIKSDSAKVAAKQNVNTTSIAPIPAAEEPKPTNDSLNQVSTQLPNESPKPIERAVKPELRITSEPSGAEIEVNGHFIGNTPTTLFVSDVRVVVKVMKSGFLPWERTLTMKPGDKRTLNAEMENGGVIKLPK